MPDKQPDTSRLCTADHLRWFISTHPVWGGLTDAELGKRLKLSAGYIGMIMSGARPPTKAFLKAIKWEAVTLYQMKKPHSSRTVGWMGDISGTPYGPSDR